MRRTHLAPLLGSEAAALPLGAPARGAVAQRLRGRRSGVWSRGEKTERSQTNLSLRGAKRRGNPHPFYAMCKYTAVKKEKRIPTTSVSTGLGMTVVFYTLPSLFSTGTYYQLEQSAKDAPSKNHPVGDGLRASREHCLRTQTLHHSTIFHNESLYHTFREAQATKKPNKTFFIHIHVL